MRWVVSGRQRQWSQGGITVSNLYTKLPLAPGSDQFWQFRNSMGIWRWILPLCVGFSQNASLYVSCCYFLLRLFSIPDLLPKSHMRSGLHGGETQPRWPFVRAPEGHFINLLSGVCVLPSFNRTESVTAQIEPENKIGIGFKSPSRLRKKKIISYW